MIKTQAEKIWAGGAGAVALLLLVITYFFFVSPEEGNADDVRSQTATVNSQNSVLQTRINSLGQQNKRLSAYQQAYAQAQLALPSTSGLPDFLRTLQRIGSSTLTQVPSLTVGTPTDVTAYGVAKAAAPGASGLKVYALPITTQVSGTVDQLDEFLTQLQAVQPRAVLISSLTQTTGTDKHSALTTLELTLQAFVAPTSATESAQLANATKPAK